MIAPIGSLPSLPPLPPVTAGASTAAGGNVAGAAGATAASGATAAAGSGFSNVLGNVIDSLQQAQSTASVAEANAAAGQGSLTDTMIAATKASLDTQVATSILDKGLAAYTSIANMTF